MWRSLRKQLPDVDKDDLLEMIGLESRRSTGDRLVPALALFGAGVLVGVGLGLMLAPKPGEQLRADLKNRLGRNGQVDEKPVASAPATRT
ncbi:MAG: hypothetical protein U0228_28745 [Myxococcaceae bacterium]